MQDVTRTLALVGLLAVTLGWVRADGATASYAQAPETLIAFERSSVATLDDGIHVMSPDGGGKRLLVDGFGAQWSPDGRRIAFTCWEDSPADWTLCVINRDGSGLRRLVPDVLEAQPSWSPDGKQIAFTTYRGLSIVEVESGSVRPLTRRRDDENPVWSPDGRRIAFLRLVDDQSFSFVIATINPDGTGFRTLTHEREDSREPVWSPNGRRIAYQGGVLGGFDIFVMNADGSNHTNLTRTDSPSETRPKWSPSGRWIAFESRNPRRSADIHTIRADGARHRRLTRTSRTYDGDATWSPDGRSILFESDSDGNRDVYVMSAAGRNLTNLTNDPKGTRNENPAWSP